mgnify:CR=1 FL=1
MRQQVLRVTCLAAAACLAAPLAAQQLPLYDPALARLSEEAEAFQRLAPKIIGSETLHHKGRQGAPRVKWFSKSNAPAVSYRTTDIVSEYGFGFFNEAPDSIREFRQVVSVDGRARAAAVVRDARQVLAENMASDDDRLRRRLLEDFERYGQTGSATDFGQMLLLFRRRSLPQYTFERMRTAQLGDETVEVVQWRQGRGAVPLYVYSNRRLERLTMQGEIWLRQRDHLPMRITMHSSLEEDGAPVTFAAEIDYKPSRYGLLLPSALHFEKRSGGLVLIDNRSEYSGYQMFGADSAISFEVEEESKP